MPRILFFLLIVGIVSCVPKKEEEKKASYKNIELSLKNEQVRELLDFQDKMMLDSLYPYLQHVDPSLRYLAINAMSSQSDEKSIDSLLLSLNDANLNNKSAAAYALGQSYNAKVTQALISVFIQSDTSISVNNVFNRNILEAVGKTGDANLLSLLSEVNYLPSDDQLILGQVRAIYRFALRGIRNKEATVKMVNYVLESPNTDDIRILASAYLARSKELDLSKFKFGLTQRFMKEKNVFVKMNLATVIGRFKDLDIMRKLMSTLKKETDYRVKINIIKTLGNYPYINIIEPLLDLLSNKNIMVAHTAAVVLAQNGNKYDANIYRNYVSEKNHFSQNAKIYSAVLQNISPRSRVRSSIARNLKKKIENANSAEEKIAFIRTMGYLPKYYKTLIGYISAMDIPVKTAVIESLVRIYKNSNKVFGKASRAVKRNILNSIRSAMETGDAAIVAVGAGLIADESNDAKLLLGNDISWLTDLQQKIKLPKEIETYNELSKAIAFVEGHKYEERKLAFQHPIDWSLLEGIDETTRCVIKTNKGNITVELYPMSAPGSVANFINLVKNNFYADKVFHRVVPNFVIQTGCPRGDGYGSLDYSIRSELSGHYYDDEGYLGMASAGKNTESTQWFITHSPTPHLDGKYTIFGKVTNGMDIVHNIIQGDKIIGANLISN